MAKGARPYFRFRFEADETIVEYVGTSQSSKAIRGSRRVPKNAGKAALVAAIDELRPAHKRAPGLAEGMKV